MPQPLTDARFVTSASDVRTLGVCHAEVAFVGRSNVGKSSLLNALANQKQLARVSKTPGRRGAVVASRLRATARVGRCLRRGRTGLPNRRESR